MKTAEIVAIGAGLGLLAVAFLKNPMAAGKTLGAGAVDLVDGVVSGGVYAIGERMGLPNTSQPTTQDIGRAQLAAGDYWGASFNLPAGEFISGSWNRIFN